MLGKVVKGQVQVVGSHKKIKQKLGSGLGHTFPYWWFEV